MSEDFIEDILASPATEIAEKQVEETTSTTEEKVATVASNESVAKGNDLPGVQELAKQLGWREDHTGEDSVDAATYILRSKDIQKSMSQHNKDLKEQLQALNGSVNALKEHNEKVYKTEVKKLEAEIVVLKKERRSAIELADVDKVELLDKQIEDIQKDIAAPKETEKPVNSNNANSVYDAWIKDNDWYLKDDDMAKFADTVAQQYVGAPLDRIYKIVRSKVQEIFPEKFEAKQVADTKQTDKVKTPVGPANPVERSSAKGSNSSFTKADLTDEQRQIMNQFVRMNIMTEEAYINDVAKMQE